MTSVSAAHLLRPWRLRHGVAGHVGGRRGGAVQVARDDGPELLTALAEPRCAFNWWRRRDRVDVPGGERTGEGLQDHLLVQIGDENGFPSRKLLGSAKLPLGVESL